MWILYLGSLQNKKKCLQQTRVSFHPGREQTISLDWELIPVECTDKEHALHAFVSRALAGDVIHCAWAVTGDLPPLHLLSPGVIYGCTVLLPRPSVATQLRDHMPRVHHGAAHTG